MGRARGGVRLSLVYYWLIQRRGCWGRGEEREREMGGGVGRARGGVRLSLVYYWLSQRRRGCRGRGEEKGGERGEREKESTLTCRSCFWRASPIQLTS